MTKKKVPEKDLPPAVSSADLQQMVEDGLRRNRADWESQVRNLTGAGPQPCDDSAFGAYPEEAED